MKPRAHEYWTPDCSSIIVNRRRDRKLVIRALQVSAVSEPESGNILEQVLASSTDLPEIMFDRRDTPIVVSSLGQFITENKGRLIEARAARLIGVLVSLSPREFGITPPHQPAVIEN